MKRFALPLLAIVLLAGCTAPEADVIVAENTVTPTPSPSATRPPSPSAAPTPSMSPPAAAAPAPTDLTAQVKAASPALESTVKSATLTEPGRVVVESTLIDPRGDSGSAEAMLAIQLCNDVVSMGDISDVSIMENDGSTWILYGRPAYGGNTCTEV